jgi:hypothetical protein
MAEREGFEPPIRLPVCRISSAVHSTALPPLQAFENMGFLRQRVKRKGRFATAFATQFSRRGVLAPPATPRQRVPRRLLACPAAHGCTGLA